MPAKKKSAANGRKPDLERRLDSLDENLADHRNEERDNGRRITALGGRVDSLAEEVRGNRRSIETLTELVVKNHQQVLREIRKIGRGE